MNSSYNALSLGLLAGFGISFLSPKIQIWLLVFTAGFLWDRWDRYIRETADLTEQT